MGQCDDKRCPFSFFALKGYGAASSLHNVVGQREANSRTARLGGEVGEENAPFVFVLDSFSVVLNTNKELVFVRFERDLNSSVRLRSDGLCSVFDEIADGTVEIGFVAVESEVFCVVEIQLEDNVLGVIVKVHYILDQFCQIKRLRMVFWQFGIAGEGRGYVRQGVDLLCRCCVATFAR